MDTQSKRQNTSGSLAVEPPARGVRETSLNRSVERSRRRDHFAEAEVKECLATARMLAVVLVGSLIFWGSLITLLIAISIVKK
jgi:hypothetical protein